MPIEQDKAYFPTNEKLKKHYLNDYTLLWKTFLDTEHRDDKRTLLRHYFRTDLFFLLYYGLNRSDINDYDKPFLVDACKEIVDGPQTDTVDLWARGHYKSSLQTQGRTIQELITHPDISVGIFSHTRPIAKDFMLPIKSAFEGNEYLRYAFPDIIWEYPRKEAPVWSMDAGLELKRKSVSNTHSLESWGLVDGMPTALATDTPVLTSYGWKNHGDLEVGDYIYDEDGHPVEVIFNTGSMLDQTCYEVKFKDTKIIAAKDHLWPIDRVVSPRDKKTGKQTPGNQYLVREFVPTYNLPVSHGKNKRVRVSLPRTPELKIMLPYSSDGFIHYIISTSLLVDPYVLGIWLGDGTASQNIVTTQDDEIVQQLEDSGYPCEVSQDRDTYKMYKVHNLWSHLKDLNVARNKHIPEQYLLAGTKDRRSLLQGLMDSDGSCHSNGWGQCVFTNTNKDLIDGVHFLASSLGMQPGYIREYISKEPNHKNQFSVSFLGIKDEKPFRLTRKLKRCRDKRYFNGRYVSKLTIVESRPVNCIQVRSTTGLYLAGKSLVVTHNSKHFHLRVYDDVITDKVVTSPEMLHKAESQFRLSDNLSTDGGRQKIIGTNYSYGDFYQTLTDEEENGIYPWHIRRKPWYDASVKMTPEEKVATPIEFVKMWGYLRPILLTPEQIYEKRVKQARYIFNCQMALNPTQDDSAEFLRSQLKFYKELPPLRNKFIFVDPANEKKRDSDYTVIVLISIDASGNKFLEDMVRDRLNLGERWKAIRSMVLHHPDVQGVWYEKYGKDSDIWYLEQQQKDIGTYFNIEPMGGQTSKKDRIRRLVPIFEQGKFFLPEGGIIRKGRNLSKEFIDEEYALFPFCKTYDMLDSISRIEDPEVAAMGPVSNFGSLNQMSEEMYDAVTSMVNI